MNYAVREQMLVGVYRAMNKLEQLSVHKLVWLGDASLIIALRQTSKRLQRFCELAGSQICDHLPFYRRQVALRKMGIRIGDEAE